MARVLDRVEAPAGTPRPGGLYAVAPPIDVPNVRSGLQYEAEDCGVVRHVSDGCHDATLVISAGTGNDVEIGITGSEAKGDFVYVVDGGAPQEIAGPAPVLTTSGLAAGPHVVEVYAPDHSLLVAMTWTSPVGDTPLSSATKSFDSFAWMSGQPFVVYRGYECAMRGDGSYQDRAMASLANGEGRGVEEHLWASILPAIAIDVTPAAAVSAVEAVALLEAHAAGAYLGMPMLHAGVDTAVYLKAADAVVEGSAPGQAHSITGTPLVMGAGYYAVRGPGGAVAGDGEAWLYITGPVRTWREPAVPVEAHDYQLNRTRGLAERRLVTIVECFAAAVLVTKE